MQPLKTVVPPEEGRPREACTTLHGVVHLYKPLDDAHREGGKKVRDSRCIRRLTLRQAADLFGLSVVHVCEIERGVRGTDYEEALRRLSEAAPEQEPIEPVPFPNFSED